MKVLYNQIQLLKERSILKHDILLKEIFSDCKTLFIKNFLKK